MGNFIRKYFKEEDFEEALEKIDQQMSKVELRILNLLNLKRTILKRSLILTIIILIAYFVSWKWYIPRYKEQWMNIVYVLIFPSILLIEYLIIKLNNIVIQYLVESNELKLNNLRKTQELKLDALKKKTDWDRTMQLIDRYEKKLTPIKKNQEQTPTDNNTKVIPKSDQHSTPKIKNPDSHTTPPSNPVKYDKQNVNPIPIPSFQTPPSTEISRSVLDRLLDYIIGDSPTSGFALICVKCHFNNGLIPKDEMDSAQFICKRCQYFNSRKKISNEVDESSNNNDLENKNELTKENNEQSIIEYEKESNN